MKARALLIGIVLGAVMVGTLASQTKSASPGDQNGAQWSATILLNDDFVGLYKDKKFSELPSDDREKLNDYREAGTKFATAFALDRACKGLTLLLDSKTGWPYPGGQYWWIDFRLGPKETLKESTTRVLQSLAAHRPESLAYIHSDNPWFNWAISQYSSPGTVGGANLGEDSDISLETAAHKICTFVKSGGAVSGGTGVEAQTAQAPKSKEPTATEVFRLRSECSEFGKQVLDEIVSNLPKEAATVPIKKSQVSHYNPTANRCYVETTFEMTIAGSPYRDTVVALYDGQTHENLAALQEEGVECPSGKECKSSGSIRDTTQHYGVDENLEHVRKFMADAMEYPQQ